MPSFVLVHTEFSRYTIVECDLKITRPGMLPGTHQLIILVPGSHKRLDQQVSSAPLAADSFHAVVCEAQVLFGIVLVTSMKVRIGLWSDAHHGKGIRRGGRKLSVIPGGAEEDVHSGGNIVLIYLFG